MFTDQFSLVFKGKLRHIRPDVDAGGMESGVNPEQTRCGNW